MHLVRNRSAEFGVRGMDPQALSFDLTAAVQRKDAIISGIVSGIQQNIQRNDGIDFITGQAEFTSPVDLKVDAKALQADKTILTIGSTIITPPIPG